jgi:hypothetical protein
MDSLVVLKLMGKKIVTVLRGHWVQQRRSAFILGAVWPAAWAENG